MSLLQPTHAVKEKIIFLASLPTLSNEDRELHNEAVLSTWPMVVQAKGAIGAIGNKSYQS